MRNYLYVYFLIILNQSILELYFGEKLLILVALLIAAISLVINPIKVNVRELMLFCMFNVLLLTLVLYSSGSYSLNSYYNVAITVVVTYIFFKQSQNEFIKVFLDIVFVLSILSLITYVFQILNIKLGIIEKLPIFMSSDTTKYYGEYIYYESHGGILMTFFDSRIGIRNNGIFPEPGKYQLVLSLALYMILYIKNHIKRKKLYIFIYLITIISTFSVTAFISLFMLLIPYIFKNGISYKKIVGFICVIVGIVILCNWDVTNELIVKKTEFDFSTFTFSSGSGNTRLEDASIDLKIFTNNILGLGYEEYLHEFGENRVGIQSSSNGLTSILAIYGIFIFTFIITMYIGSFMRLKTTKVFKITIILLFLNCVITQNFMFAPLLLIFIFDSNGKVFDFVS